MLDQRKKVALAVGGSVGLHILVLFLWALTIRWLPDNPSESRSSSKPSAPIRLTLEQDKPDLLPVPTPTPTPTPPPNFQSRFLDAHDLAEAATPPSESAFQSDRNTVAASEEPSGGDSAMPTQQGRPVPEYIFNTQEYQPLEESPAPPTSTPPLETSPPLPRAVAQQTPSATPAATPAPAVPPKPADLALADPSSVPAEPNPYDPSFRAPTTLTEPPRPNPFGTPRVTYHPQEYKTAMSGSVGNKGAASAASTATPMGRYQATVYTLIKRRWHAYMDMRNDVAWTGSVTVQFMLGTDGKARGTRVVASTANEACVSIALQSIQDSPLPPMPPDVIPSTPGGQLPTSFTFELLDTSAF